MLKKMGRGDSRRTALGLVLVSLVLVALVVPAAGYSGKSSSAQSGELEVFSWWTGGGEAAGLTKVIAIWNKQNPNIKFVNAAVAGGAGHEREGRARPAAVGQRPAGLVPGSRRVGAAGLHQGR